MIIIFIIVFMIIIFMVIFIIIVFIIIFIIIIFDAVHTKRENVFARTIILIAAVCTRL